MNVTINTDASFCHDNSVGGFAFWITCNNGRIKMGGALKEVSGAMEAEMQALANAVHTLEKSNIIKGRVDHIYINSDCLWMFKKIGKGSDNYVGRHIANGLSRILKKGRVPAHGNKKRYSLRHVKAHTHRRTKRNWVNDWCDKEARKHMESERERIKKAWV